MSRLRRLRGVYRSACVCSVWAEGFSTHLNHVVYLFAIYFIHSLLACPELCSCPETSHQATCTSAGLTEIPRNLPPSLTTMDLPKNKIHTLTETSLAPFRSLVNLKLKENELETIHNGAFNHVRSLQTLDLSHNKLTELTEFTFQGATGILHLDISNNLLENIDGAFSGMTKLSRLDLEENRITRITQDMLKDLVDLRYLLLAGNQITDIDKKAFKNLEKLTYLVLKGNPISTVSRFQFNSYYLSYVDLSECDLNHVPRGLPNSIRYLQLRRNNLTMIRRHTFQDCPFVSILVLDDNGITEINERTFEHMTYLQQLWLNNNNLRRLPSHLPTSLQRLLMDQNHVEAVNDNIFKEGSQLQTLSLMGNNITYFSHRALYNVPFLQSLDLSNNQLHHMYGNTFLKSERLETLQLSKNPLQYFHSRCFHGLALLQTLSLAYIPTVVSMYPDIFHDLDMLSKLDLDSSHWIIRTILATEDLLSSLSHVEDLSMQSSDLQTLREDFMDYFPKLATFHVSSTRWHCDKSMIWLRNWLLTTEILVENRDDITCFTPHDLYGRSLTSLMDYDFIATTTTKYSTALPTAPGQLTTFPSTLPTSPSPSTTTTQPAPAQQDTKTTTEEYDFDSEENYYEESKENPKPNPPLEPFDFDALMEDFYGNSSGKDTHFPQLDDKKKDSSPSPSSGGKPATDYRQETNYDPNKVEDGNLVDIRPLNDSGPTKLPPASSHAKDNEEAQSSKGTIIIIVATTVATVIVAAVLIFIIVYLSRKHRDRKNNASGASSASSNNETTKAKPKPRKKRKDTYQNGIKYKSRNDVLYFMPKSTEGSTSESLHTNNSKEGMTLIPGRDINHEGPLRVYKWEDF